MSKFVKPELRQDVKIITSPYAIKSSDRDLKLFKMYVSMQTDVGCKTLKGSLPG